MVLQKKQLNILYPEGFDAEYGNYIFFNLVMVEKSMLRLSYCAMSLELKRSQLHFDESRSEVYYR